MKENLAKLADACVEAHINANSTMDAKRSFKALIQQAYELGVRDHAEEEKSIRSTPGTISNQGSNQKIQTIQKETSSQESKGSQEKESRPPQKDPGLEKAKEAINNF